MSVPIRPAPRVLRLILLVASFEAGLLKAESDPDSPLDPVVVTATRTPSDLRTLGTAAELLTPADLDRLQVTNLGAALDRKSVV